MFFVLKAFENEVSLLIFEFFDSVVCSHVVEFADFVALDELLIAVVEVLVLFFGKASVSVGMEHVRAEV